MIQSCGNLNEILEICYSRFHKVVTGVESRKTHITALITNNRDLLSIHTIVDYKDLAFR